VSLGFSRPRCTVSRLPHGFPAARRGARLLVEGKIDREVYERWNRRAGGRKLPEHVGKRKRKKGKTKRRRTKRHA
jgi:hypothetical protein